MNKARMLKSSDTIIKLQADLIACQEKKLDEFDNRTSEFVDKLNEKMEELPSSDENKKIGARLTLQRLLRKWLPNL